MKKIPLVIAAIVCMGYIIHSLFDIDRTVEFLAFEMNIWLYRLFWFFLLILTLPGLLKNVRRNPY
ncbi:hypothetical protein B7P33_12280 [Sediminicola luteus]|uniref:Uncharacterized protein n=1 Tax=Sediminicola luteus TaxID=319238 RepID=A0A2A4G4X8_9FLAO|nr:hypothetical protein B7P33_12280 [Sediminicola luteus]